MDPILERYQHLESKLRAYIPNLDTQRLFAAFTYADNAHQGQLRKDGSPYITHPLAVAEIVAELGLDTDSVIAALLHDTIEDTGVTYDEVKKKFGESVADIVDGVTKLSKVQYTSKEEEQMENLRKMLVAMVKDIRVILVKICDRLHNMRTMEYQTPRKQKEKALETMEIYAPLAHRLGMQKVKWELEDTSLRYLDPAGYKDIQDQLNARTTAHEEFMAAVVSQIKKRLAADGISCEVYGRIKHIYSIYRKMYNQNKTLDEIFDLYALRVIVDDIPTCYNVLGVIHDMYTPVLGRFKDYIGTPKPNMYQSLHTTVIGKAGLPFEVQIRTREMHQMAEYGVAAHWKYKQGLANTNLGSEATFEWIRKLLESQTVSDAEEFVHRMKVDLFADEVFVFTPQSDVISLPAGATPIDFAYAIHSQVGNHMVGARVNGRMVPFDAELHSGDIVEIQTSKSAHGPSRDWSKIARSNEARTKIRQWFKKERREENITTGREMFEAELKHYGISMSVVTAEDALPMILKKVNYSSLEELYAAIGYGGTTAVKAVERVRDELRRQTREKQEKAAAAATDKSVESTLIMPAKQVLKGPEAKAEEKKAAKHSSSGVVVEGLGNCLVKYSKCCSPVPGDPIVGFITRGYGVSVHRTDCPNASKERRDAEPERWVPVAWADGSQPDYKTTLELSAKDRDGLTLSIASVLSASKSHVTALSARALPDGLAVIHVELAVRSVSELDSVIVKLRQVPGIDVVRRVASK